MLTIFDIFSIFIDLDIRILYTLYGDDMKHLTKLILIFMTFLIQTAVVDALSLDSNTITLSKGESSSIGIYANLDEEATSVAFSLIFTSYDVPATFKVEDGFKNVVSSSIKNTVTFDSAKKGKVKLGTIEVNVKQNSKANIGSVRINNAVANLVNGKTVKLNSTVLDITVGVENTKPKESNLLKEIKSNIATIELKNDVHSYEVNVSEDVKELDLVAIPKNEKSKVEISSQKVEELKDGNIIITVTSPSLAKEEYKIKVNILKPEKVNIDNEEFESNTTYKWKWVVLAIISGVACILGIFISKKER